MVTDRDNIIEAFTEVATHYERMVDSELRRFWGWSYGQFVDRLLRFVPLNEEDVILDLATGTALIPRQLAKKASGQRLIVGLDITLAVLREGRRKSEAEGLLSSIAFVGASAMELPFADETFTVVICGLGTHHMDVSQLLSESRRVLKPGGSLTVADVAVSPMWRLPGVRMLLRIAAFFYFLAAHSMARAWAEAAAASHVYTVDEWRANLARFGFADLHITQPGSRHRWSPAPFIARATKVAQNPDGG